MREGGGRRVPVAVVVAALVALACYWAPLLGMLSTLGAAVSPLVLGAAVAYVANIPMAFYERHVLSRATGRVARWVRRPLCLLAALATVACVVAAVVVVVAPELVSSFRSLLSTVPSFFEGVADLLSRLPLRSADRLEELVAGVDWREAVGQALAALRSGVGGTVSLVAGAASSIAYLMIALVFAGYLLLGKERLAEQLGRATHAYLSPEWEARVRYVVSVFDQTFHRFIVGQCLEAVVLGTLCALGMALLGFPYAVMTGTVVGATALIPVVGAYIGGAVGFLLVLTDSPVQALLFVVFLVVLQQLEGDLIYPRVVGSSIGLPGVWVLAAVTVGGGVGGILGMLLGVPTAASLYRLLAHDVARREEAARDEAASGDDGDDGGGA